MMEDYQIKRWNQHSHKPLFRFNGDWYFSSCTVLKCWPWLGHVCVFCFEWHEFVMMHDVICPFCCLSFHFLCLLAVLFIYYTYLYTYIHICLYIYIPPMCNLQKPTLLQPEWLIPDPFWIIDQPIEERTWGPAPNRLIRLISRIWWWISYHLNTSIWICFDKSWQHDSQMILLETHLKWFLQDCFTGAEARKSWSFGGTLRKISWRYGGWATYAGSPTDNQPATKLPKKSTFCH